MKVAKKFVIFMISVLILIIQIVLWIPSYIYMATVLLIVKIFKKDLRKILDPIATLLDDNYNQNKANCSIVSILKIGGDLSLQQIRNIFSTNVLEAKIKSSTGHGVSRYPELTQCQVNYLGYRFWKQDEDFQIENQVFEDQSQKAENIPTIHKTMLNKVYPDGRSPWEIIIVRNYRDPELKKTKTVQTLLILRIHHSMADGKSVVKLLVEGLGKKKLTAVTASHTEQSIWDQINFYLWLPYHLIRVNQLVLESQLITQKHPWCVKDVYNDLSPIYSAFSEKTPMNVIKLLATKQKVRMSSVILLIISNAIRNFHKKKGKTCNQELPVYCMLPKEDHPDFLKNHLYIGVPSLPVDEPSEKRRIQKCEAFYNKLRTSPIPQATEIMANLVSTWVSWMRYRLTPVRAVSTVVSNIAGEEVGFNVGSYPCTDFTMTVGFRPSSIGVQFFVLSYKNSLQFSVQTKASVMDESDTKQLADLIGLECEKLLDSVS